MRLRSPSLEKYFPFLKWTRTLDKPTAKKDLIAGLTGMAIILPQGVAFAIIAGMPPIYGLYTSMVPAIVAALFGSSYHLVSGPTTAASIIMYSSLSVVAQPGSQEYITLAITLSFMVGFFQLLMGLAKLGTIVNFISNSVIIGFTSGTALIICIKQLKTLFGIDGIEENHFIYIVQFIFNNSEDFHPMVVLVGFFTIITALSIKYYYPKAPHLVIALVLSSVVGATLNAIFSVSFTGITMVGSLPASLPPLSMPKIDLATLSLLMPLTVAMTLFALTEAISISRSISLKTGQSIHGNQEFIGQGLSNIAGSFFSSYVSTGSFNRSSSNYDAGAQTPLASIISGVLLLSTIFIVAPMTQFLPHTAIAGIIILVAIRIIDIKQITHIVRADRGEAIVFFITFLGTLFFSLEFSILFGVLASLFNYLRTTARPRLSSRLPDISNPHRRFISSSSREHECPQLKILRLDDSLYFGSNIHIQTLLKGYREKYPKQRSMLLLTGSVSKVDLWGAETLSQEAIERRKMGGALYIYRPKESQGKILKHRKYIDTIGQENIFDTKHEAVSEIFKVLDRSICEKCQARVFNECQQLPPPIVKQKTTKRKKT